jgi:hypothetical protein
MNAQERPPLISAKLVFGLIVIILGLILMADSLHWYDAWQLLIWWPLALAAIGLARLAQDGPLSLRGHIWLAFSAAGFIQQFGPWGLLDRWWPVFLIWGGAIVALRAIFPQPKRIKRSKGMPPTPPPADSCDPGTGAPQVKP